MKASLGMRTAALLFSMATVGGLIGFGWERVTYEPPREEAPEEFVSDDTLLALRGAPKRPPEEEELLRRALSHFPPYPRGSRPEVLAGDYLGPNAPISVAWLSTRDSPGQVLEHYRQQLLDAGLPVIGQRQGENAGFVGYWSPATQEVYLVSVLAQGGETLVFISAGQPGPLLESPAPVPEWIPLPSRLEQPLALTFKLEGTTQYTVSGQVRTGSLEEVASSFQSVLLQEGWSVEVVQPPEGPAAELSLHRGDVRGTAVLRREPPSRAVHLLVSLRSPTP